MRSLPRNTCAAWLACLTSLTGCAVGGADQPGSLEEALPPAVAAVARRTETPQIEAVYSDGSTLLSLRNAAWPGAATAASNVKYGSDEDVQNLLGAWTKLGFFNAAGNTVGRAKATLVLRINDQQWVRMRQDVRIRPQGTKLADITQFNHCLSAFQHVYNNTVSFRAVQNVGSKFFEQERDQARVKQESALRRWGQK